MSARLKFAHAVLMTNQVAAMRDWYCTVLEAHVVYENPMLCFVTFDEEHHRLAFVGAPDGALVERPPNSTGLMHTAFTFPDLGALLDRYERLAARGIEPRVPIQHGVTTSLYYRDPDGQFVELQVDNFASAADGTAYMYGPEFAADPIGPVYDPARMLADYRAGVPAATLQTRAWALAGAPMPHALELFARGD
ncbi:MAG: VOC family protein [Gammaproteobacteria bacterium]